MKKYIVAVLAVLTLCAVFCITSPKAEAATVASGECGEQLTWVLDDKGKLTVSGTGEMYWEDETTPPWAKKKSSIKTVVIEDGVTNVGTYAFNGCENLTSVTIGSGVKILGKSAFYGCEKLKAVTIPGNVAEIGESVFQECFNLTSVSIENGVEYIGAGAFNNCPGLVELIIPGSVYSIGNRAFASCAGLAKVTIGSGVNVIGGGAFDWCSALTAVSIPDSVQTISLGAFQNCKGLTSITIGSGVQTIGNEAFRACTALTEIKFNASQMDDLDHINRVFYDAGKDNSGIRVIFGTAVFRIPANLFNPNNGNNVPNITQLEFGNAYIISVGSYAFYKCTTLKSIYMDDWSVWCQADFEVNSNPLCYVQEIYVNGVLQGGIIKTSENTRKIGTRVFENYTGIVRIELTDSVTGIGSRAFANCTALESVTLGNDVERIGREAFYNCTGLTSVTMGSKLDSIELGAFTFCSGLTELTLPDSVTTISNMAFSQCTGLKSVTLGSQLRTIGVSAFEGCTGLAELTIPDAVSNIRIENSAFAYCTGLASVTVGFSVNYIGPAVFNGCSGLKEIYFKGPAPIFDGNVFYDENGWGTPVIATAYYPKYQAFWTDSVLQNYGGIITWKPYSDAKGTCGENLTWTLSDDGVLTIVGTGAMTDWSTYTTAPWYNYRNDIKDIVIGNGVTSIGRYAFYNLTALTDVVIPDNIMVIGGYAFSGCSALERITLPFVGESRKTPADTYQYPFGYIFGSTSYTGSIKITQKYYGANYTSGTYYIPATLKSVTVTGGNILSGAFEKCTGLTELTISDGVTYIEADTLNDTAWYNNQPDGLVYAGKVVYDYKGTCPDTVTIKEGTRGIGGSAFLYCTGLTSVTIPDSVITIGESAFNGCTGLTSVTIGDSVTTIGASAFRGCTGLTGVYISDLKAWCEIDFGSYDASPLFCAKKLYLNDKLVCGALNVPNGTDCIGNYVFYGYSELTSVTIPDSVTTIGEDAFYKCTGLTGQLTIPNSVTSIGVRAFDYCNGLKEILFTGIAPAFGDNVFRRVTATAYYPADDPTWTEDVRQNYGGTITWVAYQSLTEGTCGEGVGWKYDEDTKTLTIYPQQATRNTVQGTMTSAPWKLLYGDEIEHVVIEEGVLNVAEGAFEGCDNLQTVTVAKTVTDIGGNAFANCVRLTSVTFEGSAPTVDNTAFDGTNATVYHPAEDETWDEETKENIGNTTIFVPIGGTVKPEKFDIDVARMILGNSLEFQFGVAMTKIPDTTGYYAVVEKQCPDGTTTTKTIPASQWGKAGAYWAIVYDGLAAKEMADEISVTIYNADGKAISNAKTDSVRSYVARAFTGQTAKGKTMMVDMLNYGAAAQVNFNYGTDDLCNSKLTDAQKACGTTTLTPTVNNQATGPNFKGARLILESRIQMQVAFSGMTRDMYAVYSYTDHNGTVQNITVQGTDFISVGGILGIELDKLVYADARTLVTVRVYNADGTLYSGAKDSIQSYVNRTGETDPLFEALMKFTDSAKIYLH